MRGRGRGDTLVHVELKCHYLAGTLGLGSTGERWKRGKKQSKMVLNSFIIQMNGNHVDASGRGRASVSE